MEQLKKIEALYSSNIQEKGTQSTSVGWNTEQCQKLRFDVLKEILPRESTRAFSINDYGAGYGALLKYLEESNVKVKEYNAYDISAEMLNQIPDFNKNSNAKISTIQSSKLKTIADFSFVSGTFNVRFDASAEQWEEFIKEVLNELNCNSEKGFAFNLLTKYVDYEADNLYYADPLFWFDYCKKHFSKYVTLIHDYPLWEWTILVRKNIDE